MYNSGHVLGKCTVVTTCAAVLPNTGSNRPLFVAAAAILAFGVISLAISGVVAVKQRRSEAKA